MDYAAYLVSIIEGLVANPAAIGVVCSDDEKGVLLTLNLHPDDMGRVIGKGGETAKAIRSLLHVAGMHRDARISLKINEPEGGRKPKPKGGSTQVREVRGEAPAMKSLDEALESAL